ncbi:MAG: helix-turn-helix domain-containing protein [Patescibacteria group bacterium]
MIKLADITTEFEKYILIHDRAILPMLFATLVGNMILRSDPIWLMIVAPSSGGKSTMLAPICAVPNCHFLDDLTEKTFLSGFKIKGKESSLLKQIGSGILCFSDFTSILSKNPMSRGEILGQLRLVYDGKFSKRTGTGEIKWEGKIGTIAASTPDIYNILEQVRSMGERFMYYTLIQPTDDEIVLKQQEVQKSSKEISEIMQPFYKGYMEDINDFLSKKKTPPLALTPVQQYNVNAAAIFCVTAKATVHLDFKSNKPDAIVNKPGVGRDRKMFQTLLHALQVMNCYEHDDITLPVTDEMVGIIQKCAWSSVGRERRKILEILTSYETSMTASEIGASDDFGLPKESVEKYLYVLHAVGLVQMKKEGNSFKWFVGSDETKDFVRSLSGVGAKEFVRDEVIDEEWENYGA